MFPDQIRKVDNLLFQGYCVNQSTAGKVLRSLRDAKPELDSHLQVWLSNLLNVGSLTVDNAAVERFRAICEEP